MSRVQAVLSLDGGTILYGVWCNTADCLFPQVYNTPGGSKAAAVAFDTGDFAFRECICKGPATVPGRASIAYGGGTTFGVTVCMPCMAVVYDQNQERGCEQGSGWGFRAGSPSSPGT